MADSTESTGNTTVILGRIPERFVDSDKYTDSLLAVSLPDGTVGQILMRNGKAFLYGHYGEEEINAFKDDEGLWKSNFVVTNSFEVDGDFIFGGESQKIYAPFLTPGILYVNEDHELCTSVEDETEDILQADNYEYRPTFVKSVSGAVKSQPFTDSGMTYNPFTKTLTIENQVTTKEVYSETELTVMSGSELDVSSETTRFTGTTAQFNNDTVKIANELIIGDAISIHSGGPTYSRDVGTFTTDVDTMPTFTIESTSSEYSGINFTGDTINVWSAGDDSLVNFYDEGSISNGPIAKIDGTGNYCQYVGGTMTSLVTLIESNSI